MRKILWSAIVAVCGVGLLAGPAQAKAFTIDRVAVEATVNPDASMDVVEHLTYQFNGEFHNGTRPILAGDYHITDMKVSENGQPLPFDGAPNDLAWHFTANNERRTFDISYKVLDAVKVGPDVGELYWKFTGSDFPQLGSVRVDVHAPSGDALRAWAHGPLSGILLINGADVRMETSNVPAGVFVEARMTLPSSNFLVAPSGAERLPGILAEEQTNADQANAQRNFTAGDVQEPKKHPLVFNILSGLAIVLAILAHLVIWRRWGKEPQRPENIGKYWYEPPDVAPATVTGTLGYGDGFAGTLVDLAQRGYLSIQEVKDDSGLLNKLFGAKRDWVLIEGNARDEHLQPFETRMLQYLFEEDSTTTQSALKERAQKHPTEARTFMASFQSEVKDSVDGTYWVTGTGKAKFLNVLVAVVLAVLGIVSVAQTAFVGFAAVVVALLLVVLTRNMSRRTELGAQKAAQWQGLRNYLHDFSNFKDAPIGHMILWERYLVFGVALGVAKELAAGLELRVPEVSENSANFAPWYVGGAGDIARIAAISTFANGVTSAMSPPSQNSSGSGFGGGGFSGGGGGGGGGGGAGAS